MLKTFYLIFLLFLSLQLTAQANPKTLKTNTGFQVPEADVIQSLSAEIMHRNDINLVFQVLPNQRSLLNANSGIDDGEAARIFEINQTLLEMKADGSFDKIKSKFYTRFEQVLKNSVTLIPYEK